MDAAGGHGRRACCATPCALSKTGTAQARAAGRRQRRRYAPMLIKAHVAPSTGRKTGARDHRPGARARSRGPWRRRSWQATAFKIYARGTHGSDDGQSTRDAAGGWITKGLVVACGEGGALRVHAASGATGGRRMAAADYFRGPSDGGCEMATARTHGAQRAHRRAAGRTGRGRTACSSSTSLRDALDRRDAALATPALLRRAAETGLLLDY